MLEAICFFDIIERIYKISGVRVAIGCLEASGKGVCKKTCKKQEFKSFKDFTEKASQAKTNIAKLEGASHANGNIFILKLCPFLAGLKHYLSRIGKLPEAYKTIVNAWTENGKAAASPFCLIHQAFRIHAANKTFINKKSLEVIHLGCRAFPSLKIVFAEKNIKKLGIKKNRS